MGGRTANRLIHRCPSRPQHQHINQPRPSQLLSTHRRSITSSTSTDQDPPKSFPTTHRRSITSTTNTSTSQPPTPFNSPPLHDLQHVDEAARLRHGHDGAEDADAQLVHALVEQPPLLAEGVHQVLCGGSVGV